MISHSLLRAGVCVAAALPQARANDAPVGRADSYEMTRNTTLAITLPNGTSQVENVILGAVRGASNKVVTKGSTWKYWAKGSLPSGTGSSWYANPAFNDSSWFQAASELGYGDSTDSPAFPEGTVIGYGGNASNRYVTTYFRKKATITNIANIASVDLQVMRDDGIIFYINGVRAFRNNISTNPTYSTLAGPGSTHEHVFLSAANLGAGVSQNWEPVAPNPSMLVEGTNLFAAQVHQQTVSSSDLSFDAKLSITRVFNPGLLRNDVDANGDPLTAALETPPAHGTLNLNADGTFSYTPTAGYFGADSFTYRVSDGTLQSDPVTVSFNILPGANSVPVANADSYSATEDVTLVVNAASGVLANDVDGNADPMTTTVVTQPTKGSLVLNADGSFSYTPQANVFGTDTFTYTASDGQPSAPAPVTITIASQNDAPVAVNETYIVEPGQSLNVPAATGVLANDTDAEGASLSALLVTGPASDSLTLNANGSFSYTPVGTGVRTFTYKANDGAADSNVATVTLAVTAPPTALPNEYTTNEDTPLTIAAAQGVLVNDTDPEGQPMTAVLLSPAQKGVVDLRTDGSFDYTPNENAVGDDTFTYKANDGYRSSAALTVTIHLTPVNDAPVVANDVYQVSMDLPFVATVTNGVLSNDQDPESSAMTCALDGNVTHGALTLNANGSFSYTPLQGYVGEDSFSYTVSDGALTSAPAIVTLNVVDAGSEIVISEIMCRPGTTYPENTAREYVELFNRGTLPVDIGGWELTAGVHFTIPANTVLAAGQYLVIAADAAAFHAAYPSVSNFIGGWAGTLSNSGETLTLSDDAGEARDNVDYTTDGDWATRIRETKWKGWAWSGSTNGGGKSIELRNPDVSNDNGQNWKPSNDVGGTPGRINSVDTTNIPPIVHAVSHSPAVPKSTEQVIISCALNDESPNNALSATLYWRSATSTTVGAFAALPMSTDGRGNWFAMLGPKPNRTIVEFYISATDGVNTRTWPAPTTEGQNANCQYQVDDEPPSATAEMVRLVMTAAENKAFDDVGDPSDRQFNTTLIVTRGTENKIRYRCDMRIRGNSSRSYMFRPMRVNIPLDDHLDGTTAFNCNPKASYLQFLGMRLFQAAGLKAPNSIPIELRRNGIQYATTSGSTPDYGMWARVEDLGGEFVDRQWPDTGNGGAYKKGRNDYYWRSTQAAPTSPGLFLDGWGKQNNRSLNDWSDVRGFFSKWMAASAPHFPGAAANNVAGGNGSQLTGKGNWDGTPFTSAQISSIETVADLDQWARWFAVMTILQDNETNVSNGQDDDYGAYFEPKVISGLLRRRLQFIPHDLDTILGKGDAPLPYNARGLFDMTDDQFVFRPLLPLFGNNTTAGNAAFRTKYFNALKQLLGTTFDAGTSVTSSPPFYASVDYYLTGWATSTVRSSIKSFMKSRRSYLLSLMGATVTRNPDGTSHESVTSAHGPLMIHEILANNVSAHANGGLYPDVIELKNSGTTSVSMDGKKLSDDPSVPGKFIFPNGTVIPANGILVIYADSQTAAAGIHAGFGLDADGDAVYLYESDANGGALIDSIQFGLQPPNYSIGRTGATLNTWSLCTPTIGAANVAVASFSSPDAVVINEWLGNADYRAASDFVELYNPGTQPVALGGMSLTNDFINAPERGKIMELSFMAPGGFVAFLAKGSSANPSNARELPFGIDATFGSLSLLGANSALVDRVDTITQFRDVSVGRSPDGSVTLTRLSLPSPGASNAALPAKDLNLINHLRITEMMYRPSLTTQSEYIELRNMSDKTSTPVSLDLTGVYFASGINFTFPTTTLPAGGTIIIVGELAKFQAQFPSAAVGGVFASGKLDNSGERIELKIPSGVISILDFNYSNNWYPTTDGGGDSLQIVDGRAHVAEWDKKSGWQAGTPSPGASSNFGVSAGPDLNASTNERVYLDGSVFRGSIGSAAVTVAWTKVSGPGTVTFTTANYEDANAVFSLPGTYVLQFAANATSLAASDTMTVTVTETFEAFVSRNSAGGLARNSQANDAPSLITYATGSDVPFETKMVAGALILRYTRSKFIDPNTKIIPQCSIDFINWYDHSNSDLISEELESDDGSLETWRVEIKVNSPKAFARLRVVTP